MKLQSLKIPTDSVTIAGLRYLPEDQRRTTTLIFSHGFTSGKFSLDSLASYLAGRGYEGLTYDFRGHKLGATGGELTSVADCCDDLKSVLKWVRENSETERIVLIGHSLGAAVSLKVASDDLQGVGICSEDPLTQPLAGVASICFGIDPWKGFETEIGQAMLSQREDYVNGESAEFLLKDLSNLALSVAELGEFPALFIAAKQDVLVPVERVAALSSLSRNSTLAQIDSSHLEGPDRSRPTIYQWLNRL